MVLTQGWMLFPNNLFHMKKEQYPILFFLAEVSGGINASSLMYYLRTWRVQGNNFYTTLQSQIAHFLLKPAPSRTDHGEVF